MAISPPLWSSPAMTRSLPREPAPVDGRCRLELAVGVREMRSNPRIEEYFATTTYGRHPNSEPWRSAFVNFCVTQAGVKGTNSALALSWLDWGTYRGRGSSGPWLHRRTRPRNRLATATSASTPARTPTIRSDCSAAAKGTRYASHPSIKRASWASAFWRQRTTRSRRGPRAPGSRP